MKKFAKIKNFFLKYKDNSTPIGLLDGGFEGINIFNELTRKYPAQSFIYINDAKFFNGDISDTEELNLHIKANIDCLLNKGVKIIICLSYELMILCKELFDSSNFIIYYLSNNLIEYVNNKYEHKNIAFFAKESILKENIFQKDFKYNHLYNIPCDDLEKLIMNKQTKTALSFETVKNVCKNAMNKQLDAIVFLDSILSYLKIEFKEYITYKEIVDLSEIAILKIKNKLVTVGKSQNYIISSVTKNEFLDNKFVIKNKYKYSSMTYENNDHLDESDNNGQSEKVN
ncbi:MAG: hypothetical protein MRZ09_06565 [Coprobacillus sp.]|nr:hypothetical protein [Coprobacillus sp.]